MPQLCRRLPSRRSRRLCRRLCSGRAPVPQGGGSDQSHAPTAAQTPRIVQHQSNSCACVLATQELMRDVVLQGLSVHVLRALSATCKRLRQYASAVRSELLGALHCKGRAEVLRMEATLLQHNPDAHSPGAVHLREPVYVTNPLDEDYGTVRDWDLSNSDLQHLPESFCSLAVQRNLDLSDNPMEELPTNFGELRVGGNLKLAENLLEALPSSWGTMRVGGDLDLSYNLLEAIPEINGLVVGGTLDLSNNQLQRLPTSFGQLSIGGDLALGSNMLTQLPGSFSDLVVEGNLSLSNNQLAGSLPKCLFGVTVAGDLDLEDNEISKAECFVRSSAGAPTSCVFRNVSGRIFTESSEHFNTNNM